MWGFVPYILPTAADGTLFDVEEELKTMHLGSYIKNFTLDLKVYNLHNKMYLISNSK